MKLAKCHNISDLRELAKRRLPTPVFHYIDGGSDDELTLRRNTAAFDDYELLPSQLSNVETIDTQTTLLGQRVEWPVMISPTGASKLFHAAGEPAVAKAAHASGMIYSLSTLATTSIEDAAAATNGPKMYQVYIFRDRGLTAEHIERCKEAGYKAICLTADTPVAGNRERDFLHGFLAAPKSRIRQVAGFIKHPGWLYRALIRKDLDMINISGSAAAQSFEGSIRDFIDAQMDRSLTWKDVEWLANRWDGPLVVKGIQTVADCQKALDAGATAVMLSNHGGRQLESAPAPVDCIADVAEVFSGRLEIICDGGIRRGNHIVKALANGADACSIGRGYLYGLAAGGQDGVQRALEILRSEFERTMALVGCDSIGELGRQHVNLRRQAR